LFLYGFIIRVKYRNLKLNNDMYSGICYFYNDNIYVCVNLLTVSFVLFLDKMRASIVKLVFVTSDKYITFSHVKLIIYLCLKTSTMQSLMLLILHE
jgi:hypothetical protein